MMPNGNTEHTMTLAERCRIHAHKMDGEGWYVTSNVLWLAAEALEKQQAVERPAAAVDKPWLINGRPVSDYYSPDALLNGNRDNFDIAIGYLARVNPEACSLIEDIAQDTQRNGFKLTHMARRKGVIPFKVKAPKVLVECGITHVNAYPVSLLRERFGA